MPRCCWLELDDDGRVVLVTDPGGECDLTTRVARSDYEVPDRLIPEWHRLDAERRAAEAFGSACRAEGSRHYGGRFL